MTTTAQRIENAKMALRQRVIHPNFKIRAAAIKSMVTGVVAGQTNYELLVRQTVENNGVGLNGRDGSSNYVLKVCDKASNGEWLSGFAGYVPTSQQTRSMLLAGKLPDAAARFARGELGKAQRLAWRYAEQIARRAVAHPANAGRFDG